MVLVSVNKYSFECKQDRIVMVVPDTVQVAISASPAGVPPVAASAQPLTTLTSSI